LLHYYLDVVSVKPAWDLGRSPHAVSSGGGPIQFNLDKTHFNILGE